MPGLSKVIVLDADVRARRQLQLGFQREGVAAEVAEVPREGAELALEVQDAGLVMIGGADLRGLELVRQARQRLEEAGVDAPIVFAGRGVRRTDAEAAGADEVLLPPTYLRDVVTIGRLLRGQPATHRDHLVGSLVETTGVLTLVRALAALGRSAVLTLIRGLRRGEVRFYHGEVTSAHVGLSHGQAALHQLLLWTDARFDFHHEDIVRRHQIPLDRDELFADAERFLSGVRESSGPLSPSMVLEQDIPRIQSLSREIPTEVSGVLRMFDGHRVLADVLEDSPYRLFETLRVAQLAVDAGLLRQAAAPRPRPAWRAVLELEEWLVGGELRGEVREGPVGADSGPIPRAVADKPSGRNKSGPNRSKGSRKKRKKRRANTPAPARREIDWGALVPRIVAAEVGPLACVVPTAEASGEFTMQPREELEEVTDPELRARLFSTEPTVFWDEAAEPERRERERERAEAAARLEADVRVAREAAELAVRLAEARATTPMPPMPPMPPVESAAAPAEAAGEAAAPDPAGPDDVATRRLKVPDLEAVTEPAAPEPAAPEMAGAPEPARGPEPGATREPGASEPAGPDDKTRRIRTPLAAEAAAPAGPVESPPTEPVESPPTEQVAVPPATSAELVAAVPAAATAPAEPAPAEPVAAAPAEPTEPVAAAPAEPTEPVAAAPAEPVAAAPAEPAPTEPVAATPAEPAPTEPVAATPAEPAPAAEPVAATPAEPTVVPPAAAPAAEMPPAAPPPEEAPPAPAAAVEAAPDAPPRQSVIVDLTAGSATPTELLDEPSDGVIRQIIATAETAPTGRRPVGSIPVDDRPEDATGEIETKSGRVAAVEAAQAEPSILIADLAAEPSVPAAEPSVLAAEPSVLAAEPSALVADLAEAHTAVATVAAAQAAAPPTPSMATPVTERTVAEVSDDAAEVFSDIEEDFFRAGHERPQRPPTNPSESFADLDEGYQPVGFWDRLLGRKPKR